MKITNKYITIIAILMSIGISLLFFGQNLDAQMGIIDDHIYISRGALNNPGQVINNFINATEITQFGQNKRFRIMYMLINDVEASVFGMNALYFYIVNILVFAFFIFTIFYVTWKYLNMKWATSFTLFVLCGTYFAHIFTRLGTAEIWAMLGVSIYALGYSSLFKKIQQESYENSWREWMAMFVGPIVAIGSKENFAIMFVAVISMLIFMKHYSKITKNAIWFSMFMLFANAYQMAYVFTMQMN